MINALSATSRPNLSVNHQSKKEKVVKTCHMITLAARPSLVRVIDSSVCRVVKRLPLESAEKIVADVRVLELILRYGTAKKRKGEKCCCISNTHGKKRNGRL